MYVKTQIGVRGIPLSYVIRESDAPAALEPLDDDVPYSASNGSFHDELENHMPHSGVGWREDNAQVFNLLLSVLQTSTFVTSLKGFQTTRNGREAWKNLVLHNLSESTWDKRVERAENIVLHRTFDGKNYRYMLHTHCNLHRETHQEMIRASQSTAYQVPDERTRVTRLLKSIQTQHQQLQSAKVTIENDPVKRGRFEEAADFLCKFAPKNNKSPGGTHRISAVDITKSDDLKSELKALKDVEVDVRYYKPHEWQRLSKQQRKKCVLTRKLEASIDTGSGRKRKHEDDDNNKQTNKWRKKIEKQGRIIASLKAEKNNSNANPDSDKDKKKKIKFNKNVTQRRSDDSSDDGGGDE